MKALIIALLAVGALTQAPDWQVTLSNAPTETQQFVFGSSDDQKPSPMLSAAQGDQPQLQRQHESKGKKQKGEKNKHSNYQGEQIPEIPEEMMIFMGIVIGIASLVSFGITLGLLYCCCKRRSQRNAIKSKMNQLQTSFASANNLRLFEMRAQPNFPRTIHI